MTLKGVKILKKINLVSMWQHFKPHLFHSIFTSQKFSGQIHWRVKWIKTLESWRWLYSEKRKNVEKNFVYWLSIWDLFLIIAWERKRNGLHVMCLYLNFDLECVILICRKILSNRVGHPVSSTENERYNIACVWLERRLLPVVAVSKLWKSYLSLYSALCGCEWVGRFYY